MRTLKKLLIIYPIKQSTRLFALMIQLRRVLGGWLGLLTYQLTLSSSLWLDQQLKLNMFIGQLLLDYDRLYTAVAQGIDDHHLPKPALFNKGYIDRTSMTYYNRETEVKRRPLLNAIAGCARGTFSQKVSHLDPQYAEKSPFLIFFI